MVQGVVYLFRYLLHWTPMTALLVLDRIQGRANKHDIEILAQSATYLVLY